MNNTTELGPYERYQSALNEGRFEIQCCSNCRNFIFQPRTFCPNCSSESLDWVQPSGNGIVHATTTVRVHPEEPYNVALVELDEGVRLMTRVEGLPPDSVTIGMPVQARVTVSNGTGVVVFEQRRS